MFEKYLLDNKTASYADVFKKNFEKDKNKNLVIYGKGIIARNIIENCKDYNIVGIMDKNQKSGVLLGKRVLDFDEALLSGVDMIITATKDEHVKFVCSRIGKFCSYNQIMLYDYKGNNLLAQKYQTELERDSYFDLTERDLISQIESHDVISFDIFDTLLMRKTLNPRDVFDIIDYKLKKQGINIESYQMYRKMAQDKAITNPNIYEIYDKFQEYIGISDRTKKDILTCELEVEKSVLIPRYKMVEILHKAVEMGKKVYLVSDMYLPEEMMEDILSGLGIHGYEKIFISCDYRTLKMQDLYKVFLEETQAKNVLHIGDNMEFDGECAKRAGIDSFIIKSAKDMLDISSYARIRSVIRSDNERAIAGMMVARIFNNPFCLNGFDGRIRFKNLYDLSYNIVAPLITGLALWFIGEIRKERYDKVLFSSRDGYLLKLLYDIFMEENGEMKLPESVYFYVSRRMLIGAVCTNKDELEKSYDFVPQYDLEKNFEFYVDEKYEGNPAERCDSRWNYWCKYSTQIYESAKEQKACFEKYLKNIGIEKKKRYAFFDFVSQGTCQYFLEEMNLLDMDSFYACYRNEHFSKYSGIRHKEWLYINTKDVNSYENYHGSDYFFQDYLFLEGVMTSTEPSLARFDSDGHPVFDKEPRSEAELEFIRIMHEGIIDYFRDYIRNLWIDGSDIARDVPDLMYHFRQPEYTMPVEDYVDHVRVYDDMVHEFHEG